MIEECERRSPTSTLVQLCECSRWVNIKASRVAELVAKGADITFKSDVMFHPIVHTLIRNGDVDAVAACLREAAPSSFTSHVDFSVDDDNFNVTPLLHLLCEMPYPAGLEMLKLIVDHIERHPNDRANWTRRDFQGNDFLSHAAERQRLACFWAVVKRLPFFDDRMEPIPLSAKVWKWDWDDLGKEEQVCFVARQGFIEGSRSTAQLIQAWKASWRPEAAVVQAYVQDGADVMFQGPDMFLPLLHEFTRSSLVDCVAACLGTAAPLDFTILNRWNRTPLIHLLCDDCIITEGDAVAMLQLFLRRWEAPAPASRRKDVLDWLQEDRQGRNFLSCAASFSRLSLFWPMLRAIDFFSQNEHLVITRPVQKEDWDRIPRSDRHRFVLEKGVQ